MNEHEKMLAGHLYDPTDAGLVRMRTRTRKLLTLLNKSAVDIKKGERLKLCQRIFGKVGRGFWLQPPFYCDYGKNIEFGESVFINFNCIILDVAKVIIGPNVLLGPNVQIYTASHPLDLRKRSEGLESGKAITIGDGVWIGGSAVLCPGVTVGSQSVIAAGAIVTSDVPPKTVAGGNPAKVIKEITASG